MRNIDEAPPIPDRLAVRAWAIDDGTGRLLEDRQVHSRWCPVVMFFGAAKESDEGDAGVQGVGSAVIDVALGDYFELIARQTSSSATIT